MRYTTNGLAPSKASEPYSGPFSLPESGTVRAVAYNEQSVASEEATTTFTLHDALSVVGAVAQTIRVIRGSLLVLVVLGLAPTSLAVTSATATTPEFRLSIKHDGIRASTGDETLRYSSVWDGGSCSPI